MKGTLRKLALICTIIAATFSCTKEPAQVSVTSVSLNKTTAALKVGETVTLTATVSPSDATDKTVTWSTSDANIATVKDGVVTAVKGGSATITAKAGDKSATCEVTVEPTEVSSITLDKTTATLKAGETVTLTATVSPSDATDKTVTWSTSDANIATVKDGVVTAVKVGAATITAMAGDKSATCEITVEPTKVSSITLNATNKTLLVNMEFKLTATIYPDNATNKNIVWSSSDSSIATVDAEGNVKAVAEGTAAITAKSEDGNCTATCSITVSTDISLFVQAKYLGGSYSMTNSLITYGSKLNWGVYNNSDKTITVKSVQLIDGETGAKGNVMTINSDIEAGANSGWTITIGLAGIHAPIAVFVFAYNGNEYETSAQFSTPSWPWSTKSNSMNFIELN